MGSGGRKGDGSREGRKLAALRNRAGSSKRLRLRRLPPTPPSPSPTSHTPAPPSRANASPVPCRVNPLPEHLSHPALNTTTTTTTTATHHHHCRCQVSNLTSTRDRTRIPPPASAATSASMNCPTRDSNPYDFEGREAKAHIPLPRAEESSVLNISLAEKATIRTRLSLLPSSLLDPLSYIPLPLTASCRETLTS